jgi:hypothetical protein
MTDEPRVEALKMIGCAGQRTDRTMRHRRHHPFRPYILIGVTHGVLTVDVRHLRPQPLGTLAAALPHLKRHHVAARGIHSDPDPRLVGLLVDNAGHVIRFHRRAWDHNVRRPAHGLDVKMVRQGGHPWHQPPQSPRARDTHGATDGTPRDPFHQPAFEQPSGVLRDEVVCEAVDTLMTAGLALMGLCAVVEVAIVLVRGRLTPWTHVSDDHRLLLTATGVGSGFGQQSHGIAWRA